MVITTLFLCDCRYHDSLLFSVLLSLHLATFVMFILFFISHRCMLELKLSITEQQKSVFTSSRLFVDVSFLLGMWTIDSGITLKS